MKRSGSFETNSKFLTIFHQCYYEKIYLFFYTNTHMNQLVAIVYDDENTAEKVFEKLKELQKEYQIELDDIAYVTKDENGKLNLHQGTNLTGAAAAGGAFWGLLLGLLFFAPFLGAAVGAVLGGAAGALGDYGIDDDFIKQLSANMKNNSSSIFVLFKNANPDKVLPEISEYGGKVLKTSLSKDAEEKLQSALAKGAPHL